MTEKVLCPYCGAEMRICVDEYSFEDYRAWTEYTSNKCTAEGPLVVRNSEDKAREDAIALALRRYTPPQRPLTLEEATTIGFVWREWQDSTIDNAPILLTYIWDEFDEKDMLAWQEFSEEGFDLVDETQYGKTWRCWERKPTDAEMREAEWKK